MRVCVYERSVFVNCVYECVYVSVCHVCMREKCGVCESVYMYRYVSVCIREVCASV